VYVVRSYLAREDKSLKLLTPEDLIELCNPDVQAKAHPAALNDELKTAIDKHADAGDTVLCISAGGGGSLDEWLRKTYQ
jgi:hypothetical protein